MNMLVVNERSVSRDVIERLHRGHIHVFVKHSIGEAVECCKTNSVSVVVIDLHETESFNPVVALVTLRRDFPEIQFFIGTADGNSAGAMKIALDRGFDIVVSG